MPRNLPDGDRDRGVDRPRSKSDAKPPINPGGFFVATIDAKLNGGGYTDERT